MSSSAISSTTASPTEETLIRRARRGDEAALAELCRLHRGAAISACLRVTRDRHEAEDAVQDALLIVARRIRALSADTNFRAYLCVVARRVALRRVAERRFTVLTGGELLGHAPLEPTPPSACPELSVLRREDSAQVASAMRSLPERQRTALVRTAVEGASYADVAADLGLQANAVAQLVHRARVNVRSALAAA